MRASIVRPIRTASWLIALFLATSVAQAGIITPDSISSVPPLTTPAVHDTVVPPGGMIEDQYADLGIGFGGTALTTINNVKVFTPANTPFSSSADGKLNYATGDAGGSVAGVFVAPGQKGYASTSSVSVEFINLPRGDGMLFGFNEHGAALEIVPNGPDVGPHGGLLAQLNEPGIVLFLATNNNTGDTGDPDHPTPWGIAQVEFGPLTPLPTPEPASCVLAGAGVLLLGGSTWRRRFKANSDNS